MEPGDLVVDRESEEKETAVVVKHSDMTLTDWNVDDETTVADDNPGYNENDDVVFIIFRDYLEENWNNWNEKEYRHEELYHEICNRGLKFYAFPSERLEPDKEALKQQELKEIAEDLKQAGWKNVDIDLEENEVVIQKFGEYRVGPDRTVRGDKKLRSKIRKAIN